MGAAVAVAAAGEGREGGLVAVVGLVEDGPGGEAREEHGVGMGHWGGGPAGEGGG